jgi:hypothetical protein
LPYPGKHIRLCVIDAVKRRTVPVADAVAYLHAAGDVAALIPLYAG